MPAYLLDTNVCVALLRGKAAGGKSSPHPEECAVSVVTAAELWVGAEKSSRREEQLRSVAGFLAVFEVLAFDGESARHYGDIRACLEKQGRPIGPLDLLIAAHARREEATLITSNLREFRRVPGLKCLAW